MIKETIFIAARFNVLIKQVNDSSFENTLVNLQTVIIDIVESYYENIKANTGITCESKEATRIKCMRALNNILNVAYLLADMYILKEEV